MKQALSLGLAVALSACGEPPVPREEAAIPSVPPRFPALPAPEDNPITAAKIALGRKLFYDKRLSRTGEIACGSCHLQAHAFSDTRATSVGVAGHTGTRNAPALVNLAYGTSFFWDGGSPTLERQAMAPIMAENEMDLPLDQAVARLDADAGYRQQFQESFGEGPNEAHVTGALATFVRALVSGDSPYDHFLQGDETALNSAQQRGMGLFFGEKAACFHCHDGFNLTNDHFADDGSSVAGGDAGRQRVTQSPNDVGRFKVPTLRNVEVSAPYMHDGSLASLEAVVEQYARGGHGAGGDRNVDPNIRPLSLSAADKADLVAFLRALTDRAFLTDPRLGP